MPRKGVSRDQIYGVIFELIKGDYIPTAKRIRDELGTGSLSTIQKHFKVWKKERFFSDEMRGSQSLSTCHRDDQELLVHERVGGIKAQRSTNELLSLEVSKITKESQSLKEALEKSREKLLAIGQENRELSLKLEQVTSNLKFVLEERGVAFEKMLEDKNREINKLQTEIKELNRSALGSVQSASYDGHEKLIEEKVKSKNLEAKILEQEKTLQALKGRIRYFENLKILEPENRHREP